MGAPMGAPQHPPCLSSPPPHPYQAGFEGGVQPAGQQVLPVDVTEKGLFLQVGASGRWRVRLAPPLCPPLYLHIGRIARATPNPLVRVSLEELEEKGE